MLAFFRGSILSTGEASIIVEVHDIGYRVFVPEELLRINKVGDTIELHLHQHIRENALELYGFRDRGSLILFERLISVSGVGPKTALSVLSVASLEAITHAIASGDSSLLKRVSGIGTKTAERIVVELKNILKTHIIVPQGESPLDNDILDALINLGYPTNRAREAVQAIPTTIIGEQQRLRAALQNLSAKN